MTKTMVRVLLGIIGLAGSAFGALSLVITLMVPDLVRCGVNPFIITLASIVGFLGAPLLALCWMKSKRARLLWLSCSIGSLVLCMAWAWRLRPIVPSYRDEDRKLWGIRRRN